MTLRLTQQILSPTRYRVELNLTLAEQPSRRAVTEFEYAMTEADWADLRWYMERYLEQANEAAEQARAERIENRLKQLGGELFRKLFEANGDCQRIWFALSNHLRDLRIEIETDVQVDSRLPWELLYNAETDSYLPLAVSSFVHTHQGSPHSPINPAPAEQLRVLLVICRPKEAQDVPFRSVAMRILKGSSQASRRQFQLDLLRPATFEALSARL